MIPAREPGSVVRVDRAGLVAAARRADCVLELVPVVGDFVSGGAPLFRVHPGPRRAGDGAGPAARLRAEEIARLVLVGPERVHTEDPPYGLRKLVDVAERSIAQPFNDPTTTLQALHRLHDLLRQLAARPLPPASTGTRTAWSGWSSARCPGTATCGSPSTRSGWPARPRRR